jgi:hypothetical protein
MRQIARTPLIVTLQEGHEPTYAYADGTPVLIDRKPLKQGQFKRLSKWLVSENDGLFRDPAQSQIWRARIP